ncbi:MAG TPA: hypothetical protein VE844_05615, partial [Gammaproteobacteria bacterium]|nr:hypothetical protein [Gammaproteobacteria bacterium]
MKGIMLSVVIGAVFVLAVGHAPADTGKGGPLAKVDPHLTVLYHEYVSSLAQHGSAAFTPSNPLLRV